MAKKRKATNLPKGTPPTNRPRTRSSRPLNETQSPGVQRKKRPSKNRDTSKSPSSPTPPSDEINLFESSARNISSPDELDFLRLSPPEASRKHESPQAPTPELSVITDDLDFLRVSPPEASRRHESPQAPTPELSVITKGMPRNLGQTMEVVITTPKYISRTPQNLGRLPADSPSPSSRPRNSTRTAVSSRDKRVTKEYRRPSHSPPASDALSDPSYALPSLTPHTSPSKAISSVKPLPRPLPIHLQPYLRSQQTAILKALQIPPLLVEDRESESTSGFNQLCELMDGTIRRNEGNSCLVLGPRGSGKSRLVDRVLASLPSTSIASPVIVRLSAHCQTNDRLAMREIARQVQRQIGPQSSLPALSNEGDAEEFEEVRDGGEDVDLPPPSHLPMLISALPALGRPVIVVLDAFDGFAAHARQALLYCLLDTVQSCRGGAPTALAEDGMAEPLIGSSVEGQAALPGSNAESAGAAKGEHGLLVLGVTSRVDCLNLLEKRVKSRFSHRIIRVKTLAALGDFVGLARNILCVDSGFSGEASEEWKRLWVASVEKFLAEKSAFEALRETFALVKDLRLLCRLLIHPVAALTASSPWLTSTQLLSSVSVQRCSKRFPFLSALPYPQMALLIAATHMQTSGHATFNLEMLYDAFTKQVRTSAAASVRIAGGALGMMKVSRGVMVGAFEHLVETRVFQPIAAPASHITREFVKYRCVAERDEIKAAVEHLGQTNLKKWFYKAQ